MIITNVTNIGDPQILLYEDTYYCYATYRGGSTEGFYVWTSTDLTNWSEPQLAFRAIDSWGEGKFWAPEVVFHNGKFVMHYSAKSRAHQSLRIGVAVADSPMGPFRDVHGKPMFDLGYATIDGSVLRCAQGNFLYYSRDCSENIIDGIKTSQLYCVRLNEDLTQTQGEHILVCTPTEPFERLSLTSKTVKSAVVWNEGPYVMEMADGFVMNYSANHYASNDYAICLATAADPFGPWEKAKNNPVLSRQENLFGAGHNAFFTGKDGQLYTVFHIQTDPENPGPDRRMVIGKAVFDRHDRQLSQRIL